MRVVTDKEARRRATPEDLYVTLGNFDGFHRGHQSVISELLASSGAGGGSAVAITFEPHPLEVLMTADAPRLLTPGDERFSVMAASGLPELRVVGFTEEIARMDARRFLESMGVGAGSHLVLGYDFHMGRDRAGDLERLSSLGQDVGFGLDVVPPVLFDGRPISSTRIRSTIEEGDVESARRMLGRPYVLAGRVVSGRGLGRGLGYATANLELPARKLLPADGVYTATAVTSGGDAMAALVYVGRRPSVGGGPRTAEVHILGVEVDLYGERLEASLTGFLRGDREFATTEELRRQIAADVDAALKKPEAD